MTMIETNRVEFKRELTRELDIEKEVVSFLNYREGGIIYIGIDDNGNAKVFSNETFGSANGKDGNVNSGITTKEIISKLNISERTIYRELSILKEMKRIRFVGSAKNGYWEILSDNKDIPILENSFGGVKESELTKRQLDIISIIAEYGKDGGINGKNGGVNSGVSTKEIVSKLNISERTVQRELSILKEMKLIRRVGSTKTGHWEILK